MENRRHFLQQTLASPLAGAFALAHASCQSKNTQEEIPYWTPSARRKSPLSSVAVLRAPGYSDSLTQVVKDGIRLAGLEVRRKRILLKPNLVEEDPEGLINTHRSIITAVVEALRSLDAAEVVVGEGCGHQRDTEYVLSATGLLDDLLSLKVPFLDLNLEEVHPVALQSYYMGVRSLYLPDALQRFDLLFSLPKMKTHHWAGVTLAMKNLFGVVPGRIYGWPKNFLHQHDIGRSILDINSTVRADFCIVDGVIAMEGNGPIQGQPKRMGILVFGSDPVAVDSTCCRLMGIDPERIEYLRRGGRFLGNIAVPSIRQIGERIEPIASRFVLPPNFRNSNLYL